MFWHWHRNVKLILSLNSSLFLSPATPLALNRNNIQTHQSSLSPHSFWLYAVLFCSESHHHLFMPARPTTLTPHEKSLVSERWNELITLIRNDHSSRAFSLMHKIHLFVSSFISFNVFISQSLHSDEILFFFISLSVLACCHSFVLLLLLLFYLTPLLPQPKANFHFPAL